MSEKQMAQRCKADMVEGPAWEDYMWPHQLDKTEAEVDNDDDDAAQPRLPGAVYHNYNYGKQGGNYVNTTLTGVTMTINL